MQASNALRYPSFFATYAAYSGFVRVVVTIFCVSHRPTTIRRADVILVLDGGRLADSGTHEQLSRRCRQYGELLMAEQRREHIVGGLGEGG